MTENVEPTEEQANTGRMKNGLYRIKSVLDGLIEMSDDNVITPAQTKAALRRVFQRYFP